MSSPAIFGAYSLVSSKIEAIGDNGHAELQRAVPVSRSGISSVAFDFEPVVYGGSGAAHYADLLAPSGNFVTTFVHSTTNGWGIALRQRDNSGGEQYQWIATPLIPGTTYRVELAYDVTGPAPVAKLVIDGLPAASITDTSSGTASSVGALLLGGYESAWTYTWTARYDNVSFAHAVQTLRTGTTG